MNFVHLHVHSHYSLLDGLAKIPDLVAKAKELKMSALALTDHGVMYGAIEFYKTCQKAGIKPIIGCELYISTRKHTDKDPKLDNRRFHLTVLAKNYVGYKNLIKIVSEAHLNGFYYKPRIDKVFLRSHSDGLIFLSGCPAAEIPRAIQNKNLDKACQLVREYSEIVGEKNFYFEVQHHPGLVAQEVTNEGIFAIAKEFSRPIVATNDIHYVNTQDDAAHEVLLKINTGSKDQDEDKGLTMKGINLSMVDEEFLRQGFPDHPECLANTLAVAEQCQLEIPFGDLILPEYPLPKNQTASPYIRQLAETGFKKRYPSANAQAKQQLEYELSVITKAGFNEYFLIVQDIVNWAKNQGIFVGPGRGSAAGSIVSYCLGITDLDPLKYQLVFERFLNPDRISPPDIDLDFADDRRQEVIQHIVDTYGQDHVAQIVTFGIMKARLAIRDVTRAMGYPYALGDQIAKAIPMGMDLTQALKTIPELISLYNGNSQAKTVVDMSYKLEGVARHASTHAAGVVITRDPVVEYVPLQRSTAGDEEGVTTQYPMFDLEAIGLLKMDILGLSNLTIMKNTLRIIRKTHQFDLKLETIPTDDRKTFKLLSAGETIGVFQLESDGMRRYLKELKPNTIEDIMAMVALYRPGPIELIPDFIAGKLGQRKIEYLHPRLEPILKDTYGIAVYQEQVLQIARDIAGFTMGEADVLRKAIGKKIKSLLLQQRQKFIEGAIKNGVKRNIAERLFDFTEPFARYGFNRAHAACYAMIAYWTAYLKACYPAAFMAALLTSEAQKQKVERLGFTIAEAERMGIKVLPPDINESFVEFGVISQTKESVDSREYIRYSLAAIKNVGEKASEVIVNERSQKGHYQSLTDFIIRLSPHSVVNKKVIESLAKTGALDQLTERNQILADLDGVVKFAQSIQKGKLTSQESLFGKAVPLSPPMLNLPVIEPATKVQRSAWEKELLGIYLSEHPLKDLQPTLQANGFSIAQVRQKPRDSHVRVVGVVSVIKKIITKNGATMLFVTIEDLADTIEIVTFPKIVEQFGELLTQGAVIAVDGRVSDKDGQPKVVADQVTTDIDAPRQFNEPYQPNQPAPNQPSHARTKTNHLAPKKRNRHSTKKLIIELKKGTTKTSLEAVRQILQTAAGATRVILRLPVNDHIKEIEAKLTVEPREELIASLEGLIGKGRVVVR